MPIPSNQMLTAEVTHTGHILAGGGEVKNVANVYTFQRLTTVDPWSNVAIANEFIASILPVVCTALSVDFVTDGVSCRNLDDALDNAAFVSDATVGGQAGEHLPDFNSVMLLLRTTQRGRSYRGRKHYGPIAKADVQEDVLVAGAVTRFEAIATAILAGFTDANGNTFIPVVFSRTLSQSQTNPTNIVTSDVNAILLNKSIGTMRRRKIKTVR